MSRNVVNPNHIILSVNGLVQVPYSDYNVNGTTLTFYTLPNINSDVEIRYFRVTGLAGPIGPVGFEGSVGPSGFRGSSGGIGGPGFKGSVGDPGGPQGFTGVQGSTGFQGVGRTT